MTKNSSPARFYPLFLLLACSAQLAGCASGQATTVEHTSRVLEPPIQQTRPAAGEFIVSGGMVEGDRIQAEIEYQPYCYTLVLDQIEHNKIYGPRKKHSSGADTVGNTIAGIGSGVLDQAAGEKSDIFTHETGEDRFLAREQSAAEVLFGVLFLASGSEFVSQSLSRPSSQRWVNVTERPYRSKEVCNETQPGGKIRVFLDDALLAETESDDGRIDLDLRTLPGACGHPVRVIYTPHGSADELVLVDGYEVGCE